MNYKFTATIQKHPTQDATYIEIPFDLEQEFGAKRVKVKATFDGEPYRGSIVKMGLPCHMIGITKAIRTKIKKSPGDTIEVIIEKDNEDRIVELPEDVTEALTQNPSATAFYETLSYSAKRKYIQWITSAKKQETRQKRITEAIIKLENNQKL